MSKQGPTQASVTGSRLAIDFGWWAAVTVVGLTVLGVVSLISPALIFTPTLPTGGDLGAHVYPFWEFVHRLIPSGAVAGWTHGWYGGMPLFYFYFPFPAIIAAALTPFVGFAIALKVVVALGPLTLPPAAYLVLRASGMSRWQAGGGCVVGSMFLLMNSYSIKGGNLLSTYMGEFSYSISFTTSLLYLAVVLKAGRIGRAAPLAAATLLCLTAMSHVLTTAIVVIVTFPLLFEGRYSRTVLTSWVLGFLLAGFWAFPFLARLPFSAGSVWEAGRSLGEVVPAELLPLVPFALFGAWKTKKQLPLSVFPLLMLPVVAVLVYAIPQTYVHGGRLLPYAFFMVHAFAGVAMGMAAQAAVEQRSRVGIAAFTASLWVIVVLNVVRDPAYVLDRVEASTAGHTEAETWDEYTQIVDAISELPPGRVFWEESEETKDYGTGMALNTLPYWSSDHPVLGGLWIESSATHSFYSRLSREVSPTLASGEPAALEREFDRAVGHARVLGGRYFLAFSEVVQAFASRHAEMTPVAEHEDWVVYEVANVDLVTVASRTPGVYRGPDFRTVAMRWFESVPNFQPWLVARGPLEWPRVDAELADLAGTEALGSGRATISNVEFDNHRIRFTTDAVGVPHMVRASFFPNWVTVGANGPYRAAPSYMVVVPTAEEVELAFLDTWVEWTGRGLTLLGLVFAMLLVGRGEAGTSVGRGRARRQDMPSYGRRR